MPWRMSLKLGDRIDVIHRQTVNQYKITHWMRGTVIHLIE